MANIGGKLNQYKFIICIKYVLQESDDCSNFIKSCVQIDNVEYDKALNYNDNE
jgi:hypothetical protein